MKLWQYFALLLLFYCGQALLFLFGANGLELIAQGGLLNWDADHYQSIALDGYDKLRTAFFPYFPLLWKYSGLGAIGMSVLNGLIFIGGFSTLAHAYKLSLVHTLLLAAVPTFVFYFFPYSESLFFAGSAMVILGYRRNLLPLLLFGFIWCSFARPAAAVFVPAIVLTEYFTRKTNRDALWRIMLSFVAVGIGLFLALCIHFNYTGAWFSFMDAQSQWDNHLRIPTLPLRSWAGWRITVLDGTALFVSLASGFTLFNWLYRQKTNLRMDAPRALVFSMWYLFGIGLLVLLFRGGELFSLNRFVFATAFFMVAAIAFMQRKHTLKSSYYVLVMFFYWLLFASYVHIQTLLKYLVATLFNGLAIWSFVNKKKLAKPATVIFFLGLVILQVYFFYRHLSGEWIA